MAEAPDRRAWLLLNSALAARTRFYPEADRSVVGTIRRGVLFNMAFWSGPARVAFTELKRVLEEADPDGQLELVVVDADGCPDLDELPEFHGRLSSGAGETAWVMEGRIIRTAPGVITPRALRSNTLDLLSKCSSKPGAAGGRPPD